MHIGFITSEYPHSRVTHAAGIATSIKNLVDALIKKGIEVTLFVYDQNEDAIIKENDVTIHLIAKRKYLFLTWYLYRKYLNRYINNVIKQNRIDILEAPDWTGITALMVFKIPLIIRLHGSDAYFCKLDERKQKLKNFIFEKLALKGAKAFIAPTTYAGKETQSIFNLRKENIKTIHYGLKLEDFVNKTPDKYRRETILYIGTIIRKKGVLELAQIFNKVLQEKPEAKLILIGADSPDIKTGNSSTFSIMQELFTERAKKQCSYLGKIAYAEVQEYIKNAHVCTFPSFAETLGMVTIESMALQKPVVNTSIGWAKELIDDGVNGYLVHPTDIKGYADRIIDLFNNEDTCSRIGKEARIKVEERFNININAEISLNYYREALK